MRAVTCREPCRAQCFAVAGLSIGLAVIVGAMVLRSAAAGPLRIGISAWPGYEFLYLAQVKGLFKEEGVDVRLVEFDSLGDVRRAFERGQLDGLGTTVVEVMQARDQPTRRPQAVVVVDYSDGADVMIGQPGVRDQASLRGARIGIELGSLGTFFLARALVAFGLGPADVKIVALSHSSMESAFKNKELDAVVTYPPVSLAILRSAEARIIFSSAQIPGEIVDVIAVDESLVRDRRGEVAAMVKAFHRAVAYAQTNPTDAYGIMAAREQITPEEFAKALADGIRLVGPARQQEFLSPQGRLRQVVDHVDAVMRQAGQITGPDRREGARERDAGG